MSGWGFRIAEVFELFNAGLTVWRVFSGSKFGFDVGLRFFQADLQ